MKSGTMLLRSRFGRMEIMSYVYLAIAIIGEVIGTSALKASNGFTKLGPVLITAIGYGVSFYFLALTLNTISVGIAYAIWAGAGIVLISLVGLFWFQQSLDFPAILGMSLIIAGVIIVNGFSDSVMR